MGVLYDTSLNMLIIFSVAIQVISIPLIVTASKSLSGHGIQA
jgi:hypothetical protein